MPPLFRSEPISVRFDHGDRVNRYQVSRSGPCVEFAASDIDILSRLKRHGIDPGAIIQFLEEWGYAEPSVTELIFDWRCDHYSLAVAATRLTRESMLELQISIDPLRRMLAGKSLIVSILDSNRPVTPVSESNSIAVTSRKRAA